MEQIFSAPNPYYPPGVRIPRYQANELPVPVLLAALGGMLASALLLSSTVALRVNPRITRSDLGVLCWFVLCGSLHWFFEGYFVLNHSTLASSQHLLAQLWKEYALSDSRYLVSDPFMLSVETITTFVWGPLCFICALSIVRASPLRHPLQIIMCIAHLYGVALYYGTSSAEMYYRGLSHSRPETLYFWGYYVGFNAPWLVVPLCLLNQSIKAISRGLRQLDEVRARLEVFQKRLGDVEPKKDR